MPSILLVFFCCVLLLVVPLVLVVVRAGRRARGLEHVAAELGVSAQDPLVVERHGRSFTMTYSPGGRGTLPRLRITTTVDETAGGSAPVPASAYRDAERPREDVRPSIVLRREAGADRLIERIGFHRAISTGDAAFDELVYVESGAPSDDVRRTLGDERLRRAVRGLIHCGATAVELDPAGLSAVYPADARALTAAELDRMAQLLSEAAGALPLFQASRPK
jgi:hypothetical protein